MLVFVVYCCAATARSVAIVAYRVCFCSILLNSAVWLFALVIIGSFPTTWGFTDLITMGSAPLWITACVLLQIESRLLLTSDDYGVRGT